MFAALFRASRFRRCLWRVCPRWVGGRATGLGLVEASSGRTITHAHVRGVLDRVRRGLAGRGCGTGDVVRALGPGMAFSNGSGSW